ncbi:hypothetical protein EVAR_8322_1 [Eumeta japonica]|uniref:Uncharacterized protein n=1 Tax=Eumeta variegata TaxID=151549 RepID=A0A4C1VCZ5_EUMVA|nr:hypothetical protein EVAR_8322_1 [Eumeta japonica]
MAQFPPCRMHLAPRLTSPYTCYEEVVPLQLRIRVSPGVRCVESKSRRKPVRPSSYVTIDIDARYRSESRTRRASTIASPVYTVDLPGRSWNQLWALQKNQVPPLDTRITGSIHGSGTLAAPRR